MSLERVKKEFEKHSGEPVEVVELGGAWYAFGSELAVLKLYVKYLTTDGGNDNGRVNYGWSENRQTFYFRLERKWS